MTDRRYGVNKYGDGKLYGASDERTALAWDVSFDWDGDGVFEVNEASYLQGVSVSRGRKSLLKKNGQGFEPFRTGTAVVTLSNHDGRFDAWNTDSPLYPDVGYGKEARIRVRDLTGSSIYPIIRGKVTNIVPTGYGSKSQAAVYLSDGLDYLRNTPAGFPLQTDITPDAAIGLILDAAKWSGGRNLATGSDLIPYCWSSGNRKAMATIEDLANSFLGYFFCDNDNTAKFITRSMIGSSVADYPQEYLLKDIDNPLPFDISRNITRLKLHPRQQSSLTTLWQTVGQPYELAPGAANARIIFCSYSYNNQHVPATGVVDNNFEANTLATFLGTDETANCTITVESLGETAKVTMVNNSGGNVHIRFELDGYAVYENYTSDVTYPNDVSTVTNPRELVFDLPWLQDPNVGRDLANVMGPLFAGLHPMPHVRIHNRPELQFTPDLTDIVTASIPKIGLSGESFRVAGIELKTLTDNCQSVLTDLWLEPYVSADDYMQWDTASLWDTETIFGY